MEDPEEGVGGGRVPGGGVDLLNQNARFPANILQGSRIQNFYSALFIPSLTLLLQSSAETRGRGGKNSWEFEFDGGLFGFLPPA